MTFCSGSKSLNYRQVKLPRIPFISRINNLSPSREDNFDGIFFFNTLRLYFLWMILSVVQSNHVPSSLKFLFPFSGSPTEILFLVVSEIFPSRGFFSPPGHYFPPSGPPGNQSFDWHFSATYGRGITFHSRHSGCFFSYQEKLASEPQTFAPPFHPIIRRLLGITQWALSSGGRGSKRRSSLCGLIPFDLSSRTTRSPCRDGPLRWKSLSFEVTIELGTQPRQHFSLLIPSVPFPPQIGKISSLNSPPHARRYQSTKWTVSLFHINPFPLNLTGPAG